MSKNRILVLGIGNILWADEGFGVRCVEEMNACWAFPANVTLMDGGTQGMYLLPYVNDADKLIIFDAIDYGLEPGTLHLVEGDEVPRFTGARKMSLHQTGFQEVLCASEMLGKIPREMLLIGVQPVDMMDYGGSLRDRVRERVPEALSVALSRLESWGAVARERTERQHTLFDPSLAIDPFERGRPSPEEACRTADPRFHLRAR